MTVTKGFIQAAATSALDTRKADEFKLVASAAGVPRIGVLTDDPSIVTSDASTAPMRVAVAGAGFATRRQAGDGAAFWGNDGSIFVTITKPGANSHYVVVWAKHNDAAAGDASSLPEIGTTTGGAAASPTVPSIPAGALELARILVPSTATSSQSAGVVIANMYPMTALRGGVVPTRNAADLAAWVPGDGSLARRVDNGSAWVRKGGAWLPADGSSVFGFARRTTGALVAPNGSYGDISATAAWAAELGGGVTYANGFIVPLAGLYVVEWSLMPSIGGSGIAGVAVSPDVPNGALLHAPGIIANGGAAFGSGSAMVRLAAGAVLKLYCYGNGSTLTINNTAAHPATHWGVRYVGP